MPVSLRTLVGVNVSIDGIIPDGTGKIGIGVTPNSGIDATAKAIQVGSQAVLATADGGQTSFLGGNIYPSGTFEQKYLTTNAGSSIQLLGGEVILNAYDIGTASATVSPTPDGNLVVGSGYVGVGGQLIVDNGIAVTTGDVAIPDKIVHAGDTNTTIRFPAADTVTVETNGVERMRITSTGNVGILTTSPSQALHVEGNVRITGAIYDSTNSPGSFGQVLHSSANGVFWDTPVTTADAVAYAIALG